MVKVFGLLGYRLAKKLKGFDPKTGRVTEPGVEVSFSRIRKQPRFRKQSLVVRHHGPDPVDVASRLESPSLT